MWFPHYSNLTGVPQQQPSYVICACFMVRFAGLQETGWRDTQLQSPYTHLQEHRYEAYMNMVRSSIRKTMLRKSCTFSCLSSAFAPGPGLATIRLTRQPGMWTLPGPLERMPPVSCAQKRANAETAATAAPGIAEFRMGRSGGSSSKLSLRSLFHIKLFQIKNMGVPIIYLYISLYIRTCPCMLLHMAPSGYPRVLRDSQMSSAASFDDSPTSLRTSSRGFPK